jgi:hypothetical protein
MRLLAIVAAAAVTTAAALAISVSTSSDSFAQAKRGKGGMTVNQCINLAIQRGHTRSAVDGGQAGGRISPGRAFVIRCLQGKQR